MELQNEIIGLIAETPVHVGIGQASEVIDLPVAREETTHFPHIPGSGMKGAFRLWANQAFNWVESKDGEGGVKRTECKDVIQLFGKASGPDTGGIEGAGEVIFGEARLALLPVRCTTDSYKWVTCPLIIRRLIADMQRASGTAVKPVSVDNGKYLGQKINNDRPLGLEERQFTHGGKSSTILPLFSNLMADDMAAELPSRLIVLSDSDFAWFARFSLPIAMRNSLDENKLVRKGALWSEETLPSDSVMWFVLGERNPGMKKRLTDKISKISKNSYIQIGGNETIGQGWFKLNRWGE